MPYPPAARAVKRAVARKLQIIRLTWDEQVSHLWMNQAVRELTANQRAATDAGADRNVDGGAETLCGSPASFAEDGAVHVCVEADRHA